jgi:hypothetical protein
MRGCLCGQFDAARDAELGEDVRHVHLDGAGGDEWAPGEASFRKPSLTRRTTSSSAGVRLRAEVRSDQQANVTAPAGGDPRKRLPIW